MKGMRGKKPHIPLRYFQSDPAASRHVPREKGFFSFAARLIPHIWVILHSVK